VPGFFVHYSMGSMKIRVTVAEMLSQWHFYLLRFVNLFGVNDLLR
jgi:hypothetical protein